MTFSKNHNFRIRVSIFNMMVYHYVSILLVTLKKPFEEILFQCYSLSAVSIRIVLIKTFESNYTNSVSSASRFWLALISQA